MLTKQDLASIRNVVEVVVEEALEEKLDHSIAAALDKRLDNSISVALDAKLGEDYMERFGRIEDNVDMVVKIASDTQQELAVTQAKVDRHDEEIKNLQSLVSPAVA